MPRSYFYHLYFELDNLGPFSSISTDSKKEPHKKESSLPSLGVDIFSELPVHNTLAWKSVASGRRSFEPRRRKSASSGEIFWESKKPERSERQGRRLSHPDLGGAKATAFRTGSTTSQDEQASSRCDSIGNLKAVRDWRHDSMTILSIDMELPSNQANKLSRGKAVGHTVSSAAPDLFLRTKGQYVPCNPKNTDLGWGIVHLYRDAHETPGIYECNETRLASGDQDGTTPPGSSITFKAEECTTLCILAVPSYMTPSDLLGFLGEETREIVSHFRLIRTERTNKYMVLMKFREAKEAKRWQNVWNGKLFNSMEPENCHVVFVKSVEFNHTGLEEPKFETLSFPNMTNDPFTPAARPNLISSANPLATTDPSSISQSLTTKPLAPPTPSLVELPTCPVCLERMDETTGLLTILCQHVFHCACLEKWKGSGCPVCRYTQTEVPSGRGPGRDGETPESECNECGTSENLWICLICGHTGCGRYNSAHAFAHWEATSHSYCMDVVTQHVWDYIGDGYVHRLMRNKSDGKVVDLKAYSGDTVTREKLENISMEYTYLLSSQLDSQRLYFEKQLERAVIKANRAGEDAENSSKAVNEARESAEMTTRQLREFQEEILGVKETMGTLERDLARQTTRITKSEQLARRLGHDWLEEKTINEALMERIKYLDSKVGELETKCDGLALEKKELQDQNQDLSFFISGMEKLKNIGRDLGNDEIASATMVVSRPKEDVKRNRKGVGKRYK